VNRILVALDGSSESEQILGEVSRIGSRRTSVDLLHVLSSPHHEIPNAGAELEDVAEDYLRRAAGRISDRTVRTYLWRGDPELEIPHAAEALHADLIAMTTHARRGLSSLLMGSVAQAVARLSALPILMTRPGLETPDRPLQRIMVPVDGTEQSAAICTVVRDLAAESGAEVVFFQAVTPLLVVDPVTGFTPLGVPEPLPDPTGGLEKLALQFSREGIPARAVVAHGAAADQILQQARKMDADLIAMSTSARRGLSRLVLGSVAEAVVRHMDRPVLLHRAPSRAEATSRAQEVHAHGAD
jgi:nucleotide-binding universal stress UspA family protein